MSPHNPLHVFRENLAHLQAGRPLSQSARDAALLTKFEQMRGGRQRRRHPSVEARMQIDAAARRFWMPMKSVAHWFKLRQIRDAFRAGEELGGW